MANLISHRRDASHAHLTSAQLGMDALSSHFAQGASDYRSVLAMASASFAGQLGRLAASAALGSRSAFLASALRPAMGLAAEASAFRATSLLLQSPSNFSFRKTFESAEWLGTASDLLLLQAAGRGFSSQGMLLRHMAQSAAVVLGQELSFRWGRAPSPQGSWAERMTAAEVMNLQLSAGMALGNWLSGGGLEARLRALTLQNQARVARSDALPSARQWVHGLPSFSMNMASSREALFEAWFASKEGTGLVAAHQALGLQRMFPVSLLRRCLSALFSVDALPSFTPESLEALRSIADPRLRRVEFLKALITEGGVGLRPVLGVARIVDFHALKLRIERIAILESALEAYWARQALAEWEGGSLLADTNFGRREVRLRVVDHHGPYSQERNSTQQLLDLFEEALRDSKGSVERAIARLGIREVSTDNLADGGWCVWMASKQRRVLSDAALRDWIRQATHFEDFSAFGNEYERSDAAVELQAALFKHYGDILRSHGIEGSDRFPPAKAQVILGEAMDGIDALLVDPSLRGRMAREFWAEVDAARGVAQSSIVLERSLEGRLAFAMYDLGPLKPYSIFAQWLSVPDLQRLLPSERRLPLQATLAPMPPLAGLPRSLPIIAIPHGRRLPSGRGLLAAVQAMNAAEAVRVSELQGAGRLTSDLKPNFWFGKENVILPNPAGGGTLLSAEEIADILMGRGLSLFAPGPLPGT